MPYTQEEREAATVIFMFMVGYERRGKIVAAEKCRKAKVALYRHLVTADEALALAGITVTKT